MDWLAFAKDFGLPITILLGVGWLIVTGRLVPGITHEDVKKQRDRALDQVYKLAAIKGEPGEKGDRGIRGARGHRGSAAREQREG